MTPEERAWKIYEQFDDVDDEACLKTIAYQIRQAEEEAEKRGAEKEKSRISRLIPDYIFGFDGSVRRAHPIELANKEEG